MSQESANAMPELELRRQLIAHGLQMQRSGLSEGTSGNLSVRTADGMLITPSGVPYDRLQPEDLVVVHPDGSSRHRLPPSSEWRFHRDIYQERPEIHAVVHAHPIYCTTLAIRRLPIPAVHYMIAVSGGSEIACAPYATYGTPELSRHAVEALRGRTACLLANHGMIAIGPDLDRAMWIALEVETLAHQYLLSLQIGGPVLLDEEEIQRVIEKFKSYGPQSRDPAG
jgi:L-fuculose-phosphate aldolase